MIAERDLYKPISAYFFKLYKSRYKSLKIIFEDASTVRLSSWLERKGFAEHFKEHNTFDIKIDIIGTIISSNSIRLILVECKKGPITLKDVSQLIGYTKIVNPYRSIIVSPKDPNKSIIRLINDFQRTDILQFDNDYIRICKWDVNSKSIVHSSIIPRGYSI